MHVAWISLFAVEELIYTKGLSSLKDHDPTSVSMKELNQ